MKRPRCRSNIGLSLLTTSACWACASQSAQTFDSFGARRAWSPDGPPAAPTVARREIVAYAGRSLADALTHLRPDWLRPDSRVRAGDEATRPVVYVDDVLSGDVRALQTIPSDATIDVQRLSAADARIQYGPACRCPAGAIRVRTRSRE